MVCNEGGCIFWTLSPFFFFSDLQNKTPHPLNQILFYCRNCHVLPFSVSFHFTHAGVNMPATQKGECGEGFYSPADSQREGELRVRT